MAVADGRPAKTGDGATPAVTPSRTTGYLEACNVPYGTPRNALGREGSYWTGANVIGTDITAHAAPAINDAETKPMIHIFNGGTNYVYLDYIDMLTTVANASATAVGFRIYLDNKGATSRTGAGTQVVPINTLSNSTTATGVTMYFGAVTAVGTSPKIAMTRIIKEFIGVALDRYSFSFGNGLYTTPTTTYVAGATAIVTFGPPIVIAPGGNMCFCQVSPSGASTAATFQAEVGYYER